jgi:glucosamine kinase
VARYRSNPSSGSILNCPLTSRKIGAAFMYYLAIDAGGSKTEVAVADATSVLSRETGGTCKLSRTSQAEAKANLEQTVFRALSNSGLSASQIVSVCVGMSGISLDGAEQWIRSALASVVKCETQIVGDHEIAHYAAFAGEPGILVISGTGSIAIGKSPQGETARAGGWGARFSDEGSASWICELAIRKALRSRDRGSGSTLLARICEQRHSSLEQLISDNNLDCASLFPAIVEASRQGDMTAWYVLSEAGRELADMALAVSQKLRLVRGTVCGAGSVFLHAALVRSSFRGALAANAAHLFYDEKVVEPVLGAVAMARKGASA